MSKPACLRKDMDDATMWDEVYVQDDYRLHPQDVAGAVVLDVGAGVGAFARRCLDMDARLVIGVEPHPGTCDIHREVMAGVNGRSRLIEAAAWSHGDGKMFLYLHPGGYRGCDSVVYHANRPDCIECGLINFASLVAELRPDAVKVDAEGAEYELFKSLPDLSSVKVMWIEFHETLRGKNSAMMGIVLKVEQEGFSTERVKNQDGVVWKFKRRPNCSTKS